MRGGRSPARLLLGLPVSALLVLALAGCQKKPEPPAEKGVVLVSGYEPFGGLEKNTSWEVARRLEGETVGGFKVVAVELPVVWGDCAKKVRAAVREHRPRAVLGMGVAWMGLVQIETVARNERGPHPDNRKALPPSREIETGGPAEVRARLPVERIRKRLKEMGLPVALSDDAGGYLCNEAFYTILREAARLEKETGGAVPAGFIHLPRAGPDRRKEPTPPETKVRLVTIDELARGMRAVLEEMAAARATRAGARTR